MRAKLITESAYKSKDYFIDELEQELEINPTYKKYSRFRGEINGAVLQMSLELSEETNDIKANIVDETLYSLISHNLETVMDTSNNMYTIVCMKDENKATIKFNYNEDYFKKLYGSSFCRPIYIVLTTNNQ